MSVIPFKNLFETIESKLGQYIQFWKEICEIESPTYDKEGVDRVGAYFIKKARELGWKVEVFEQSVSGNALCITMNENAKGTPIAISGHMDTVHPIGSFGDNPVRLENGRIYGPGVVDCKGGIIAGFLAMHALLECGFDERPVLLLLQSDEENGSMTSKKATINWMCEKAKDCAAFLNTEQYKPGRAVIERKGILRYRLTVHGRSVHSSNCADGIGGVNAIAEAAHKIIELEKLKDRNGITCNCGIIEGGTVANTVPEKCTFVADVRFLTRSDMESADQIIHKVAQYAYIEGSSCDVEQISYRVPMEPCSKNRELLERMNCVLERAGLSALSGRRSNGGSDAADASSHGIPSIDSLGVAGDKIHSCDEFAYIESLAESAKYLAAAVIGV